MKKSISFLWTIKVLKIELISNREMELTPHGEKFAELLKEEIEDNIDILKEYLDSL